MKTAWYLVKASTGPGHQSTSSKYMRFDAKVNSKAIEKHLHELYPDHHGYTIMWTIKKVKGLPKEVLDARIRKAKLEIELAYKELENLNATKIVEDYKHHGCWTAGKQEVATLKDILISKKQRSDARSNDKYVILRVNSFNNDPLKKVIDFGLNIAITKDNRLVGNATTILTAMSCGVKTAMVSVVEPCESYSFF